MASPHRAVRCAGSPWAVVGLAMMGYDGRGSVELQLAMGSKRRSEVGTALAQLDVQAVMGRCSNGRVSTTERSTDLGRAVCAGGLGLAMTLQRAAGTTSVAQPKHFGYLGASK